MKTCRNNIDINSLYHLVETWKTETNDLDFGLPIDVESVVKDVYKLTDSRNSVLIVLKNEHNKSVGILGATIFKSPSSDHIILNEHYMYVLPSFRGKGLFLMVKDFEKFAKENKCSHIMMNASKMVSDKHDLVCKFYEKIGMKKFETCYLKEI